MKFVVFLFLISVGAASLAEAGKGCSAEDLQQRSGEAASRAQQESLTKLFGVASDTNGTLPAGGYGLPMGSPLGDTPVEATRKETRSTEDVELDFRITLSRSINAIPPTIFSDRFKAAILSDPNALYALVDPEHFPSESISVPWPPTDPKALIKSVVKTEYQAFAAQLSVEQKEALQKLTAQDPRYARSLRASSSLQQQMAAAMKAYKEMEAKRPANAPRPQTLEEIQARARQQMMSDEEIKAFGEKAKALVIQAISNGLSIARLSAGQRAMIARIKAFQVTPSNLTTNSLGYGRNSLTLSLVRGVDHSVEMGRAIQEMSRSLTDCELETTQYRVSQDRLKSFSKESLSAFADRYAFGQCLKDVAVVSESCLGEGTPALKEALVKNHVIEVSVPAIKHADLPLPGTRQCLVADTGAQTVSSKDVDQFVGKVTRIRATQLGSVYDAKKDAQRIRDAIATRPACYTIGRADQTSSAFTAWLSARAIGLYVKEDPSEERALRAGGAVISGSYADSSAEFNQSSSLPSEIINRARVNLSTSEQSNTLPRQNLIDRVILNQPELRSSLGCPALSEVSQCAAGPRATVPPSHSRSRR